MVEGVTRIEKAPDYLFAGEDTSFIELVIRSVHPI